MKFTVKTVYENVDQKFINELCERADVSGSHGEILQQKLKRKDFYQFVKYERDQTKVTTEYRIEE